MTDQLSQPDPDGLTLVTGASGYIGGALIPALLERRPVRVLTRSRERNRRPGVGRPGRGRRRGRGER